MLKRHYSWVILSVSVLVGLASIGLARFGYTMILPSMKEGLGISGVQAGDLATGNLAGYLVLALFGGFLASRFGISLYRMFILSYGEDKPIAMPDENQAHAKNRRVALTVWGE